MGHATSTYNGSVYLVNIYQAKDGKKALLWNDNKCYTAICL